MKLRSRDVARASKCTAWIAHRRSRRSMTGYLRSPIFIMSQRISARTSRAWVICPIRCSWLCARRSSFPSPSLPTYSGLPTFEEPAFVVIDGDAGRSCRHRTRSPPRGYRRGSEPRDDRRPSAPSSRCCGSAPGTASALDLPASPRRHEGSGPGSSAGSTRPVRRPCPWRCPYRAGRTGRRTGSATAVR